VKPASLTAARRAEIPSLIEAASLACEPTVAVGGKTRRRTPAYGLPSPLRYADGRANARRLGVADERAVSASVRTDVSLAF
jgi:hypothetical protein